MQVCEHEHEARGLESSSFFFSSSHRAQSHELNNEICRKKMKTSFRFSTLSQTKKKKHKTHKKQQQILLQSK